MEQQSTNTIIKCLSKTLRAKIKYLSFITVKFYNGTNKDITSDVTSDRKGEGAVKVPCKAMLCLGQSKVFIVKHDLSKVLEIIHYENIKYPEMDSKNHDLLHLFIKPEEPMKNLNLFKISIYSKIRGILAKNIMCYHSVYFMWKYKNIRSLSFVMEKLDAKAHETPKAMFKYNKRNLKNYLFYLKGLISQDTGNHNGYNITYLVDQKKGDKIQTETNNYTNKCVFLLEISDPFPLTRFDIQKDDRELSFFAYNTALNYIKNIAKANKFWVTRNEIYHKKFNLTEDLAQWEGWTIETRISDPEYANLIFIFLRRKYIPPYFDTFQNFMFVLKEVCSKEFYQINPEAYKVIQLAANSVYNPAQFSLKANELFLKAKIDSLLVDEQTLTFYHNTYNIIGEEIFTFAYEFLTSMLTYLDTTNVKEQIEGLKTIVENKKKKLDITCNKWNFSSRNVEFLKKINEFIFSVKEVDENNDTQKFKMKSNNSTVIKNQTKEDNPTPGMTPETPESDDDDFSPSNLKENKKKELNKSKDFKRIWASKLLRFLAYILDGGITDNKMRYNTFIKSVLDSCQSTNNDLKDVVFSSINLEDLHNTSKRESVFPSKSTPSTITPESKIKFNEDAMAACISSNFLSKHLETSAYKFISILLRTSCSNKILKALFDNLKDNNLEMDLSEKKNMVNLIVPLREIFEDPRRSPQTILLAGKNLCTLVKNESDILHRIKLADEGNLLKTISLYMDIYDYDEKLVLCCLDLFMYIMKELRSRLFDCLYAQGDGLMPMFIKFFSSPKVPGVYYSQRIMNKVLTILLPLTSIEESEMREMFNKPEYCAIYDLLLNIINLNTREYVIDPLEEESSVLEFKIYWLLCVLCAKNERAQDYLFTKGNLKFIIEDNSVKYRDQLKRIIALKDKLPDTDKRCIGKKIYKFCEFIYYLLINNEFRVKEFMREMKNFNEMKKFAEVRIIDLVPENEMKSDVFNMLTKIYKRIEEKYD